jgi:hypothetical protein
MGPARPGHFHRTTTEPACPRPRPHHIGLDLLLRFLHNVHPKFTGTPSEPTGGSEPTASNLLTPSGLLRYRRIAPTPALKTEPDRAAV